MTDRLAAAHRLLCPRATPHDRDACSALSPVYEAEFIRRVAADPTIVCPDPADHALADAVRHTPTLKAAITRVMAERKAALEDKP